MNTDKVEQRELSLEDPTEVSVGELAVRRHFMEIGQGCEELRSAIANARGRGIYVYAINIKWPKRESPGFFALVKCYTAEGPLVGFHSAFQLVGLLIGIGARMRSGAFEWQPDEYPASDWVEELAYMHGQELNR